MEGEVGNVKDEHISVDYSVRRFKEPQSLGVAAGQGKAETSNVASTTGSNVRG